MLIARAALALALAMLGGCYRAARPAPPPPANKASPPPIHADDVLAFLPVDSDLVVGVEMGTVRESELFQHFFDQLTSSDSMKASLAKAYACGVDPAHSLDRVTFGGHFASNDKADGVLVVRGVDGPRAIDCVATYGASIGTVTRDHEVLLVHGNDGYDEAATLVGRSVLVIQFRHGIDRATLSATLEAQAPLRRSAAFMGLFNRREPQAAIWGMVNGNASALHQVRAMGFAPRSIDGTISVATDLTAVLRVTFATPAEADQLVQTASPSLSGAKSLVEKLEVRADGTSARFELTATEAQLEALWGMVGAVMGSSFGGP